MSKLSFLSNINVVAEEKPRSTGGGARKQWNPSGLAIRVWRDGSVYPSRELVEKFDLEYRQRPIEEKKEEGDQEEKTPLAPAKPKVFLGYGFDIADTQDFPTFQTGGERLLVASLAEKDAGRVDLFYTVGYDDEGKPKVSVMDQGSNTFGKEFLIPKIEEIYGVVFFKPGVEAREAVAEQKDAMGNIVVAAKAAVAAIEEVPGVEYVDMVLVGQNGAENPEPWVLPAGKNVAFFPKITSRGEAKGQMTVARRENPEMYVFYPKQLLEEEPASTEEATKQ